MPKTKEQIDALNVCGSEMLVHILELNGRLNSLIAPLKECRKSCFEMAQILGELNARQQT